MSDENHIVISLGGSLIIPDELNTSYLADIVALIKRRVHEHGEKFIIITGGGALSRMYQNACTKLDPKTSLSVLDWVGIDATHMNAKLLIHLFGADAHKDIMRDPHNIPTTDKPIIIGGGWKPGRSSDYVAVAAARSVDAKRVLNLSNISHVYDRDPNEYSDAQKHTELLWSEYIAMIPSEWTPGLSTPFDPIAAREANEGKITVYIMNGAHLSDVERCIGSGVCSGTTIAP